MFLAYSRRLLAALLLLLLTGRVALAQSATDYLFSTSVTGTGDAPGASYTTLIGPGLNNTASAVAPIGFSFQFSGAAYTQFSVNANGELRFGGTAIGTGLSFPAAGGNDTPGVSPGSGPYFTSSDGRVCYLLTGTAPNRELRVSWQLALNSSASTATQFAVHLQETSNVISFVYSSGSTHNSSGYGCGAGIATTPGVYKCVDLGTNTSTTSSVPEVAGRTLTAGRTYTFTPIDQQPTITGFSPASGPVGTTVTITGTNLATIASVRFGEVSAAFTASSATQLTAVVPRVASTQPIFLGQPASTYSYYTLSNTAFTVTRPSYSLAYGLVASSFAGVSGSSNAAPAVADLDLDGRLDLLVGRADGTVSRYEQTAANASTFTSLGSLGTGSATISTGGQATVTVLDPDGEGLFTLLLGRADGLVDAYQQTAVGAGTFALRNSAYTSAINTTANAATAATDLTGDGNLELLTGKADGTIGYFEQSAPTSPRFFRVSASLGSLDVGDNSAPFVVDVDGNSRLDVLIGTAAGRIVRYEQDAANSTTLVLKTSTFASISAGSNAKPCVTDIDGDGLLDLLVGRGDGTIDRYEQGYNSAPTALALSPGSVAENVAAGSPVGTFTTTDLQGGPFTYSLVAGTGSTDNGSFGISGSTLTIGLVPDYETKSSYAVRVRTTDPGGLYFEQAFTITITDVAEVPTVTGFSPTSGLVGASITISGTHFQDAGAVTVKFNGTPATTVSVSGNGQLAATVPAGATSGSLSVTNSDGTGTSSGSFTVTPAVGLATVSTAAPGSLTGSSAVLGGTVSNDGGGTVTERGVVYVAGTGTPTTGNSQVVMGSGTGSFSQAVSGLAGNTTYTVRAYASNGAGTAYGASQTFTTGNNPPVAADDSYTVAEDSGPSAFGVLANDSDPDAGTTLTLTAVTQPAGGSVSFSSSTVTFTPALNFNGVTTFTYTIADGNGGSDTGTVTVTVTAVNDAPVVAVPGTQTTNEDVPFAFSAGNGNTISVSDVDAGSSPVQLSLSVGSGTLSLSGTAGLTFSTGTGTNNASMTFQGTLNNINLALNNMTYSPVLNYNGSTTLTVTANDQGNTGSGGARSDTKTLVINLTAVNDAPVVAVPGAQSTPQNTAFAFSSSGGNAITVGDVDAGSGQVEMYLQATQGAVSLSTTAGLTFSSGTGTNNASMTFRGTLAAINTALNNMSFYPNTGYYGAAALQVQANDQGNTGSGGALTDSKTVSISVVQPVNQPPVVTVPATQNTPFNTALTLSTANGNAVSAADPDAGSGQLAVYLSVGYGTATLSTTTGLTVTSGSNGSGGFGFTGTLSGINAALNGLVFRPNANYSGAASLQVQLNDQGNTGSGGARSDTKTLVINVAANQAPVLTASSSSTTWAQGGGAVAVDAALTASDADSPTLASATVSVTTGFVSGQDVLAFASANGITGSYAAGTGVLTLSGSATVANYQAALRSVTYNNSAGTPTAGSRTVRFAASDGLAGSAAVTKTVLVVVRPNTTIVSGPPTLTNSSTVSFQFSSDQSPVDYTTTGNPAFAYTGNGASSSFGPIPDGTYTLSVAAHNTSTNLTDQTPATYPFTVDTQKPGAAISSAGNTSGGSTTTSPIGFTVTFTEPVTGFTLAGITVSGGTKGNFVAVSSTQYTFDLTPAGPATYAVSVAAGVAQDAATNLNTASNTYTLAYALPVTAAPTVSYPATGSTIASPTPTYSGTASAGSTVTVYVDNASIGTTTATAGGSWSLLQPSALSQTTHTVKATAQRSGYAGSAFSAANSFTVDTTAPSVPVVSSPADGSFVGTLRPAYSGTGAVGSTITVYVDNVSLGTVAVAAGGSTWSFTQPTDLSQAAHTVKVTATDGVGNVSAFSATNTFTVDTTAPTVAVSSSAGSSGTTTGTTPVPFTITFNEPVSSFSLAGITVSSGTPGSFVAVSASQYTFSITPAGAGAIAVSVAAAVAQDRAGNNNVASPGPAFTLTYQPQPTITALSAAAELPGMPFTLTGTNFTSASTVTVGGTTASVTYHSATSLTVTVPAGAPVGSAAVVVTTSGSSSSSAPAFAVLKVYDAPANCLSATPYATTADGAWHYLLAGGQVVAALHDTNASLGTVGIDFLVTGSAQPVRQDGQGRAYLDRNFHLTASGGTFAGSSVDVRFYGLTAEQARLQAADPAATYANLKATQYSGPSEDCDLSNNSATGESRVLPLAASTPGGVPWFVAQATVADHFSEFFLTSSSAPLPVQLIAFTATTQGHAVQLAWRTASELRSARFDIERSPDGRAFERVSTVAAAGTSATTHSYGYLDASAPAGQLYYRLRQIDQDGTNTYSMVRAVTVGGPLELVLYPNPARTSVTVSGLRAGTEAQVLDALGRMVTQATTDATGTTQLALPAGLAAGMYVVRADGQSIRLTVE